MPQVILILGDSFVKRLRVYLERHETFNLDLDYSGHKVFIKGWGGKKIVDLCSAQIFDIVKSVSPEIVLLEVGSNDLDDGNISFATMLQVLTNFTMTLKNVYNVSTVAFMEIFFRTKVCRGDWSSTTCLNDAIFDFNKRCKEISMLPNPPFYFWHHKGLVSNWYKYICFDGVHLNDEGLLKFYSSVRNATIHFSNKSKSYLY